MKAEEADHSGRMTNSEDGSHRTPHLATAANTWLTPHGAGNLDHAGKVGAGGEFAQQATQWRTPSTSEVGTPPEKLTAKDGTEPVIGSRMYRNGKDGERINQTQSLELQTTLWATATAHDRTHSPRDVDHGEQLANQVDRWATPQSRDGDGRSPQAKRDNDPARKLAMNLDDQVAASWPSPAGRDGRTPNSKPYADRGGATKGEQLPNFVEHSFPSSLPAPATSTDGEPSLPPMTDSRRLNPRFVCWLMGWPPIAPDSYGFSATEFAHYKRRMRSALCGMLLREATNA